MKMNNGNNRINSQGLKFESFGPYENDESSEYKATDDIPHVEEVTEINDETGSHVLVKFDDGTTATTHTHGTLIESYYDALMPAQDLIKKSLSYFKQNIWLNKKVNIGQMMQTSMMLGDIAKVLHSTAQMISSDETERLLND